jgi:predicted NUDIX family phosphoesterase
VEGDAAWQQPIAYCLLRRGALVWTYRRRGGDGRLDGRASAGVGGHVDAGDGAGVDAAAPTPLSVIIAAARRELAEELVAPPALDPKPLAWIHEHDSPVGLVHVGLVCVAEWPAGHEPRVRRGERLESLGFRALPLGVDFERWSLLAVEALQWAS